ncbi:DUF916 and DUF3324 domain-containing protein [Lactococcus garvieae]|uniref:DUF916 and DUF3324 domain-containing protein n=1 Tax=Lactococcus garvieae TaxID=1363 RepID=UPI003852F909
MPIFKIKNHSKKLKKIIGTVIVFLLLNKQGLIYGEGAHFTVNPEMPSNQILEHQGYFDLLMKPGEKQELTIRLTNTSSETLTIESSFNTAVTNNNGLAVYTDNGKKTDSSLKYNIKDYVKIPQQTIIPSHSEKNIVVDVQMPNDQIAGTLAGGITLKEKPLPSEKQSKEGVGIINEYRYVIALLMQQNQEKVVPQLHLNKVEASQMNSRNVISMNIQNTEPTYLKDLFVSAHVEGKTGSKIKYDFEKSEMKMAPNSNFNFFIPVSIQGELKGNNSKPLEPGKYHMSMAAYAEESDQGQYEVIVDNQKRNYEYKWIFNRDFDISTDEVQKYNKNDPTINHKTSPNLLMVVGIVILIIILLLLVFMVIRERKRSATNDKR